MGSFDLPSFWFGPQPIGDDSRTMSGGSNTDRGGMSGARKKEREKSKIKSGAAHLVYVGGGGGGVEEKAR